MNYYFDLLHPFHLSTYLIHITINQKSVLHTNKYFENKVILYKIKNCQLCNVYLLMPIVQRIKSIQYFFTTPELLLYLTNFKQ